jgi:hypothetical protein
MYGLPPDFEPSMFAGRELLQVSFTINTVDLLFDDDVGITIEGTFEFRAREGRPSERQTIPSTSSALVELVGHKVVAAAAQQNGVLTLDFDNGGRLTCLDESSQFESYHIRSRTLELTV